MSTPRVILQELPSGAVLDWSVPLSGADVTRVLTGPGALSGELPEGYPFPVREWGSALWVESDGVFYGGGIVTTVEHSDRVIRVSCTGVSGYPQDMPWLAPREDLINVDPLDIVRMVWAHLQDSPDGDLGVDVDGLSSPVRVGEEERDVEFTTGDGEDVAFETGPFRLNPIDTQDLAKTIEDLAGDTPFDFAEESRWVGESIRHRIRLGYPSLGVTRNDFVLDTRVNTSVLPALGFDGEDYASEVLLIGAGEGRDAITAHVPSRGGRLRRVAIVADKSVRSQKTAARVAREELAARTAEGAISNLVVVDSPAAPLDVLNLGDTIPVVGPLATGAYLDHMVRVVEITRPLDDFSTAALTVVNV